MKFLNSLLLCFILYVLYVHHVQSAMSVVFPKPQSQYKTYFIHTADTTPSGQLKLLTINSVSRKAEIKLVNEDDLCSHTNSLFTRENTWESVAEGENAIAQYPSLDSNCDKILNDLYNGPGTVALCTQQQIYNVNADIVSKNGTVSRSFLRSSNQLFIDPSNPDSLIRVSLDASRPQNSYLSDSWWTNIVAVRNRMSFSWVLPSLYSNMFINVNDDNIILAVDVPPGNRIIPTTRWTVRFSNSCLN
jgi:hypothetical protein